MSTASKRNSDEASKNCDTLPAPHIYPYSQPSVPDVHPDPAPPASESFDLPALSFSQIKLDEQLEEKGPPTAETSASVAHRVDVVVQPPKRKLCVRHQRMAGSINLTLQKSLDALSVPQREKVNMLWTTFSSSSHSDRAIILQGILTMCCHSQLSLLTEQVAQLVRIDPFSLFPREVALHVLTYLDAQSLARAAQVSRRWRCLADDDILWRDMCEQHIGKKCAKCGWGLPLLEKTRRARAAAVTLASMSLKRPANGHGSDTGEPSGRPSKRQRSEEPPYTPTETLSSSPSPIHTSATPAAESSSSSSLCPLRLPESSYSCTALTRPWKSVYCERLTVERNWRRGRYTTRTLSGHTDGVMCLQFSETLTHPAFPVLITGSYDRTARVWNLETGEEVRCLRGHSRAVRALQFDEAKLITGSMDNTLKVWNWRQGTCIRTLEGHSEGVVCLNFDSNVLASGSVDTTVKVWNFRTGECFTLRGHRDWVNAVTLWDTQAPALSASTSTPPSSAPPQGQGLPDLDPGKMLFSASDDGTIRLWDLSRRSCVRQFTGHVGQVQSLRLIVSPEGCSKAADQAQQDALQSGIVDAPMAIDTTNPSAPYATTSLSSSVGGGSGEGPKPILISGSLDNTIKIWDVESGRAVNTLFGHIEGVWGVASDKLRLVSGSHDRTIKVWALDEGRCVSTLIGHRGAVTCLSLADDKIVSGSDDGDVRIWNFAPPAELVA